MKRLNIKWKFIAWQSLALMLAFIMVLPIMYLISSTHLYRSIETQLKSNAGQVESLLRQGDGMNEPDSGLDLIQMSTYIAVYSNANEMISGKLPDDFDSDEQPDLNVVYYKNAAGHSWMVLDQELIVNGKGTGWFRMIRSIDLLKSALAYNRTKILITIPIFILFSVLTMISTGFLSRTLSPVKQITNTAQQIGQGNMSKRTNFEGGHDELGKLAETFDKMLDRLEDSFTREKRFSSDVSHELRTPVTAIIVNAEEALVGDKTAEEYKENLNTILLEGKKMNSLISQLLMMARSIDGNYLQELEYIDLSALTHTIVEEVAERTEHSGIAISACIDEDIVMLFDETLYMRLLYNLIDNALKYNAPGGWVMVSLNRRNENVILSVEDNGIGISEKDLPKVWNRFYKANQSSINSSPGLGLSIVKWIAEQFGGTVNVTSELGKGSLFEVRFEA
jgi:signal transduction histidine kinase